MISISIQRPKINLNSWKGLYGGGIWHQQHLIPLVFITYVAMHLLAWFCFLKTTLYLLRILVSQNLEFVQVVLITLIFLSGCYPFIDRDPFFLESCPHVYFVGNQDKYDTRVIKGIVILNFSFKKFSFDMTSAPYIYSNKKGKNHI